MCENLTALKYLRSQYIERYLDNKGYSHRLGSRTESSGEENKGTWAATLSALVSVMLRPHNRTPASVQGGNNVHTILSHLSVLTVQHVTTLTLY